MGTTFLNVCVIVMCVIVMCVIVMCVLLVCVWTEFMGQTWYSHSLHYEKRIKMYIQTYYRV